MRGQPVVVAASRIACHTRSDVSGMSRWRIPKIDNASTTAFWAAGVEPIVPASPMPFAPSGLSGVVVVLDALVQSLGDALRDAAVLLPGDEERVDDSAAVVDGDVAQELDASGLG